MQSTSGIQFMSFTREQLIAQYKLSQLESSISPWAFIVSAGGALVMHGIREKTDDLDIDTDKVNYTTLLLCDYPIIDDGFLRIRLNDSTDVHCVKIPCGETMEIDGVWCYTLEHLITQYRALSIHPARKPEKVARDIETVAKLRKLVAMR